MEPSIMGLKQYYQRNKRCQAVIGNGGLFVSSGAWAWGAAGLPPKGGAVLEAPAREHLAHERAILHAKLFTGHEVEGKKKKDQYSGENGVCRHAVLVLVSDPVCTAVQINQ